MKNKTLLLTLLASAVFTPGCHKAETISQQLDQAEAKTKAAGQDLKNYSFAQKDEFIRTMQGQSTNLNENLDQLSARIDRASEAFKAEAKPRLQTLRDEFANFNRQLAGAEGATESTWDQLKADTRTACEAAAKGIGDTRQWVNEKIAP